MERKVKELFLYNGIPSTKFGIRILNEIVFPAPTYDLVETQILGRDGDLIYSNDRVNSFVLEIPCKIQLSELDNISTMARDIQRWLTPARGYKRLEFSALPHHFFKAIHLEDISIAEQLRRYGTVTFKFKCYPSYFTKSGEHSVILNNRDNIVNTNNRIAKPIWEIKGKGNVKIEVESALNGIVVTQELEINDMNGTLTLDSAESTADSPDTVEPWIWVRSYPFPVLGQGVNIIKINNPGMGISIIPRWSD